MQAAAKRMFFMWSPWGFSFRPWKTAAIAIVPIAAVAIGCRRAELAIERLRGGVVESKAKSH